jgi:hypothetical protein
MMKLPPLGRRWPMSGLTLAQALRAISANRAHHVPPHRVWHPLSLHDLSPVTHGEPGRPSQGARGVEFTWPASSSDRYFDVQIRYGKYDNNCGTPLSFKAIQPTGGYQTRSVSYDPSWTNCAPVPPGTWVRSTQGGNNYSLSGGVQAGSVIGINLSMNTSYSSTRSLTFYQSVNRHLCGNDNDPSYAGRIAGKA